MGDVKNTGLDLGLLVLRLGLGGIFIAHGVMKLLAPGGVQGFADELAKLGLPQPYWMAVAAIASELGGALLVVLGLFARLGALSLVVVMGVAIVCVHWQNGFLLKYEWSGQPTPHIPHGFEYCLALLTMALCILLAGPGKFRVPVGKKD
ncbi:MAG TPA: DoxX family protein [Planctomycetota bacterium]|nr:DoxX family protein [Planctomycetota bacterium]